MRNKEEEKDQRLRSSRTVGRKRKREIRGVSLSGKVAIFEGKKKKSRKIQRLGGGKRKGGTVILNRGQKKRRKKIKSRVQSSGRIRRQFQLCQKKKK